MGYAINDIDGALALVSQTGVGLGPANSAASRIVASVGDTLSLVDNSGNYIPLTPIKTFTEPANRTMANPGLLGYDFVLQDKYNYLFTITGMCDRNNDTTRTFGVAKLPAALVTVAQPAIPDAQVIASVICSGIVISADATATTTSTYDVALGYTKVDGSLQLLAGFTFSAYIIGFDG